MAGPTPDTYTPYAVKVWTPAGMVGWPVTAQTFEDPLTTIRVLLGMYGIDTREA
mgnify:CR=1 FL=1